PTANSLSTIQATFDRAINLSTFTPDDVGLVAPNGQRVAITGEIGRASCRERAYTTTFAVPTTTEAYTLDHGSNAKDLAGNRVTFYQGTFTITAPPPPASSPLHFVRAPSRAPTANSLSTIQATFDRAINLSTFTPDDVGLVAPNGQRVAITG